MNYLLVVQVFVRTPGGSILNRRQQPINTVVNDIDVVPRFAEPFFEVLGELDLIYNDQDFHALILPEIDRSIDYKFVI